jgi:hypothetical protein
MTVRELRGVEIVSYSEIALDFDGFVFLLSNYHQPGKSRSFKCPGRQWREGT